MVVISDFYRYDFWFVVKIFVDLRSLTADFLHDRQNKSVDVPLPNANVRGVVT